jgi:hypothetical protein
MILPLVSPFFFFFFFFFFLFFFLFFFFFFFRFLELGPAAALISELILY